MVKLKKFINNFVTLMGIFMILILLFNLVIFLVDLLFPFVEKYFIL